MTKTKLGTLPDQYYGKHCQLCGSPVNGKNDSMYGGACKRCQEQEKASRNLASHDYLGTQICPVDGFEKEISVCMERKATAIQRDREGKEYIMAQCRGCGGSVDMMPVREFYTPEQEKERNKLGINKFSVEMNRKPCAICGCKITARTQKKYCCHCAKERNRENARKAAKSLNERRKAQRHEAKRQRLEELKNKVEAKLK